MEDFGNIDGCGNKTEDDDDDGKYGVLGGGFSLCHYCCTRVY